LVDSTDQTGLLFAVKTGPTTFKMVMWIKDSTEVVDNDLVYPANGTGRWHVLPSRNGTSVNEKEEVVTIVGDVIPSTISGDTDLVALKKTDGTKELRAKFDGVFENLLGSSGGGGGSGASVSYYSINTSLQEELDFSFLPNPSNTTSFSFAVIDVWNPGYQTEEHCYYLYAWIPNLSKYVLINTYLDDLNSSKSNFSTNKGVRIGEIRNRDRLDSIGDQPYDNYADWFIWDTTGKWVALVTKDNATNYSNTYVKPIVNNYGLVTGGQSLSAGDIPSLPASKITSEVFNIARIPTGTTSTTVSLGDHNHTFSTLTGVSLSSPTSGQVLGFNGTNWTNVASGGGSGSVTLTGDVTGSGTGSFATTLANVGTAGTYTKVTTDSKGRVSSGATLVATDIPSLDTGKITTGTFDVARIPNLSTSKITSGTFDISYIPTGTTSTTVALGNHNHTFSSLSGISITSPSNGQILSYDNATSQWKNTTLPTGTGSVNSVDGAFGDVILTNTYQAKSNELTAISALADTVGYIKKTGDGTYILDNNISGAVVSVDGLTGAVSLTNTYQAKSNELTAFAGLPDTVGFIKKTADGTYTIEDITGGSGGVTSVDGLTGAVTLSSSYLGLAGGTVSGITSFSSATPSTSTTTGAIKITNGGLGVTGSGYFGGDLSHNGFFKKNGVGSGGWISMTGTADVSTPLDTSTATLSQLAQRLKGIQDALSLLGILNASSLNPFLANEILFLRGDGADNSTSIVDSSLNPKTVTAVGGAKISTTQSKLGGSSIYLDGSGDYLSVTLTTLSNFTVEAWCYLTSTGLSTIWSGISSSDLEFAISTSQILIVEAGVNFLVSLSVATPINTWNHFAFTRSSNTLRIFKNGIKIHEVAFIYPFFNGATAGRIGIDQSATSRQYAGYLDAVRITNVARYTVNFDAETDTFLS
jgi:hypothetical protein